MVNKMVNKWLIKDTHILFRLIKDTHILFRVVSPHYTFVNLGSWRSERYPEFRITPVASSRMTRVRPRGGLRPDAEGIGSARLSGLF